jgi:hypothetical protein
MPCYPAFALLIGCAMAASGKSPKWPLHSVSVLAAVACVASVAILILTRGIPDLGDISSALTQHPSAYTLSLGHMGDLTMDAFAYLRWPLALAAAAFAIGSLTVFLSSRWKAYMALAAMMVLLLHAARLAMVAFDPYLSSRPLANVLLRSAPGTVVFDDQYYTFSSIVFYTGKSVLLLNGRVNNLEYGSNAPDAPRVFIDDKDIVRRWAEPPRYYLIAQQPDVPRLTQLLGASRMHLVAECGGKYLFTNRM